MAIVNIRAAVQAVTGNMSALPVFVYGTKNEINKLGDSIKPGQTVVFMLGAAQVPLSFDPSGGVLPSFNFVLQFMELTQFGLYTADNDPAISRQLANAAEFLIRLRDYQVNGLKVFNITPGRDKAIATTAVDSYDANFTGVTLPINNLRSLYPNSFC